MGVGGEGRVAGGVLGMGWDIFSGRGGFLGSEEAVEGGGVDG